MDDEAMGASVIIEMLDSLGCDAEVVRDGAAAIERYRAERERGRPFDAVILDLTVKGGLGGELTVKRLLEVDPGTVAIASSRYADNSILSDYRAYGFAGALAKPYTAESLASALGIPSQP